MPDYIPQIYMGFSPYTRYHFPTVSLAVKYIFNGRPVVLSRDKVE
jgi:hypothetical protein